MTEHWNGLPRQIVESPSVEIFKTHLDAILHNVLYMILLGSLFTILYFVYILKWTEWYWKTR